MSKWSKYNDKIVSYWNSTPEGERSYRGCAKHILNVNENNYDVDVFRTYIKRYLKREAHVDSVVDETLHRGNLKENSWKVAWVKDAETGVSALVRNPDYKEEVIDYDLIREEMIKEMKNLSPKVPKQHTKKVKDGHCLILDIADLHIAKLATPAGTGKEYNVEIAVDRAIEAADGLLELSSPYNIEKIVFVVGNDVLHIDNPKRTTTSGTPQDTDGMWYDAFRVARSVYAGIISKLSAIAPVHVIHCPSNHDYMSGFMLADALYCYFHNNKNITFDVSNIHRKYFSYGNNMLCFSHGDGAKLEQVPYLAAHEAPRIWADTIYRYAYLHHIHHKDYWKFRGGKDYIGMTVEYLRSPSEQDSWHERNGYVGSKVAVEAFIHHPQRGQVSRLTYNF